MCRCKSARHRKSDVCCVLCVEGSPDVLDFMSLDVMGTVLSDMVLPGGSLEIVYVWLLQVRRLAGVPFVAY